MKILLGSGNAAKKFAVFKALDKLQIRGYEVIPRDVEPKYNNELIGYEVIRGAEERNKLLKEWAIKNKESYDYLCSIENGFSTDENGICFIVTYCIFEDKNGKSSIGKAYGVRISRTMFEYIKCGGSLTELIERLENIKDLKDNEGITGYLSNGLYNREDMDSEAVISALIPMLFEDRRSKLNKEIKKLKLEIIDSDDK